uniref:Uncharacterized protein n=1 Tax=Arundo donax TaxID=35708 RepID=A0A0A9F8S8_ARUDO
MQSIFEASIVRVEEINLLMPFDILYPPLHVNPCCLCRGYVGANSILGSLCLKLQATEPTKLYVYHTSMINYIHYHPKSCSHGGLHKLAMF